MSEQEKKTAEECERISRKLDRVLRGSEMDAAVRATAASLNKLLANEGMCVRIEYFCSTRFVSL